MFKEAWWCYRMENLDYNEIEKALGEFVSNNYDPEKRYFKPEGTI